MASAAVVCSSRPLFCATSVKGPANHVLILGPGEETILGDSALEKCQLKATISNLPRLLESSVGDEKENWRIGQQELLCLGRVPLKRNKILVLDEATASIDSATDAILQGDIRQEVAGCTVTTTAHRVPTVVDSDMVMVLSNGEMVEYDVPSKLIETNSIFF